ncbi:MAG: hypothetical protein BalsKO_10920 [Balneolaceae bacterium]
MKMSRIKNLNLFILVSLFFTVCCPDCPNPDPIPCGDNCEIQSVFEYEVYNTFSYDFDVFIYNLNGDKEPAFGNTSTIPGSLDDNSESRRTRPILIGESIYIKIPIFGTGSIPGINVRLDGIVLKSSYQFFIKDDHLHYMFKVAGAIEGDGHEIHIEGHPCEPKPTDPPGSCNS